MSLVETLEVVPCHCALLRATTLLQPLITHLGERRGREGTEVLQQVRSFLPAPLLLPPRSPLPSSFLPAPLLLPPRSPPPSSLLPFPLPSLTHLGEREGERERKYCSRSGPSPLPFPLPTPLLHHTSVVLVN